jgi:hypothetical protein
MAADTLEQLDRLMQRVVHAVMIQRIGVLFLPDLPIPSSAMDFARLPAADALAWLSRPAKPSSSSSSSSSSLSSPVPSCQRKNPRCEHLHVSVEDAADELLVIPGTFRCLIFLSQPCRIALAFLWFGRDDRLVAACARGSRAHLGWGGHVRVPRSRSQRNRFDEALPGHLLASLLFAPFCY